MNRRSFLRGVGAAAVAIPLAPLLPRAAPVVQRAAMYTPKYLYGVVRLTQPLIASSGLVINNAIVLGAPWMRGKPFVTIPTGVGVTITNSLFRQLTWREWAFGAAR